jgi:hypothetical protein
MKRHFFGAVGSLTAALLVAGCASDPTADLRGDIASVQISRAYFELEVGETIRLNAKAYDAQGNVVGTLPTVAVDNSAVATVEVDETTSGDPLPQTDFVVTALAPGSIVVTATAGSASATADGIMFPTSFAGNVALDASGAVDLVTVSSTSLVKFNATSSTVLVDGNPTVILARSEDEIEVAVISAEPLTDATVSVTNLRFLPPYGVEYGVGTLDSPTTVDIRTTLFDGTVSVDATGPADVITINSSANFDFNATSATVLVDGDPTFVVSRSSTQLVVAGANIDAVTAGAVTVRNARYLGQYAVASIVAQTTVDLEAFDNSLTTNDPATAPNVTPATFPYVYYTLVTPGDPDQFVKLTGALGLTARFDWFGGDDVDILWCNEDCSAYTGNFNGATGANPERSTVSIPAATVWNLWANLYDGAGSVVRVTLTSP